MNLSLDIGASTHQNWYRWRVSPSLSPGLCPIAWCRYPHNKEPAYSGNGGAWAGRFPRVPDICIQPRIHQALRTYHMCAFPEWPRTPSNRLPAYPPSQGPPLSAYRCIRSVQTLWSDKALHPLLSPVVFRRSPEYPHVPASVPVRPAAYLPELPGSATTCQTSYGHPLSMAWKAPYLLNHRVSRKIRYGLRNCFHCCLSSNIVQI